MMASRGCSIVGSGTSSQRMSDVPCQHSAFIKTLLLRELNLRQPPRLVQRPNAGCCDWFRANMTALIHVAGSGVKLRSEAYGMTPVLPMRAYESKNEGIVQSLLCTRLISVTA